MSSPCGKTAFAVANDRADQRARSAAAPERLAEQLALGADLDVEDLEAVALEHRDLLRARVVREADDLLGGDQPRVDRPVDAGALEHLDRVGVVHDRDREGDAVELERASRRSGSWRRRASRRRRLGLGDPLALDEVGVHAGRVEDPCLGELLRRLAGPVEVGLDDPDPDPLRDQNARRRESRATRPVDDDVFDPLARRAMILLHACAASGEPMTMIRSPGSIVSSPRGTTIESPRMMLATFESGGISRLPQRHADHALPPVDVELDDLHLAVGEDVRLPCGGHADRPRDASAVSRSDETMRSKSS